MRAASLAGTEIPKLCATDMLEGVRIVPGLPGRDRRAGRHSGFVHHAGRRRHGRPHTAERLDRLRRGRDGALPLRPSARCLTCAANGDCELQDMARRRRPREVRYNGHGATHLGAPVDVSNPYFDFDPGKCIVCSRCVRACDEVQGTFALTISGRGFASHGLGEPGRAVPRVRMRLLRRLRQACPTGIAAGESGQADRPARAAVVTTCAYCGVGCAFKAEMRGEEVVRMVPWKDGKANHGHSCVKGRFAWGYASHKERILEPDDPRASVDEPWREVSWDEAIAHTASEFKRIQGQYGGRAIGGITSSRCTNEETFLVQKLVRAGFGNNNVDTCARVCHSPTGYGLKTTFGTSAGTQDFDSVEQCRRDHRDRRQSDRRPSGLRLADEAAAAPGREADRHRSAPHRPGAHAACRGRTITCRCKPGTNVAVLTAMAHVIVTEGLADEAFVRERCDRDEFERLGRVRRPSREHRPRRSRPDHRRAGRRRSAAPRGSTPPAATARSITASASPSTARAPRR